jgi:hypothetical protein
MSDEWEEENRHTSLRMTSLVSADGLASSQMFPHTEELRCAKVDAVCMLEFGDGETHNFTRWHD